jgi:3-hydroxy-9,10-secoandrosta-1,3,5(10)-triene-9,17-dione monooxygenase reductase component
MCKTLQKPQETLQLREALGQFPTGVAIVTAVSGNGKPVGMTINSFTSISLSPPLVAWSIDRSAGSYLTFAQTDRFAITLLSETQDDLALRFATRGADKFRGIAVDRESPLIPGGCAWFRCVTHHRALLGDHLLLVGEVIGYEKSDANPLLFSRGRFTQLPTFPAVAA